MPHINWNTANSKCRFSTSSLWKLHKKNQIYVKHSPRAQTRRTDWCLKHQVEWIRIGKWILRVWCCNTILLDLRPQLFSREIIQDSKYMFQFCSLLCTYAKIFLNLLITKVLKQVIRTIASPSFFILNHKVCEFIHVTRCFKDNLRRHTWAINLQHILLKNKMLANITEIPVSTTEMPNILIHLTFYSNWVVLPSLGNQ